MRKNSFILICFCTCFSLLNAAQANPAESPQLPSAVSADVSGVHVDSAQMERDLQHMTWEQFRSVIETIPKMKADIEAYGAFGWQYVKQNYSTYHWKKNIDRLEPSQKQRLAELIQTSKASK